MRTQNPIIASSADNRILSMETAAQTTTLKENLSDSYLKLIWKLERCGLRPRKKKLRCPSILLTIAMLALLALIAFYGLRAAGFGSLYIALNLVLIAQTISKLFLMLFITKSALDKCADAATEIGLQAAIHSRERMSNIIGTLTSVGYLCVGIHVWHNLALVERTSYLLASVGLTIWQISTWRICGAVIEILATGMHTKVLAVASAFDAIEVTSPHKSIKDTIQFAQCLVPLYTAHEEAHSLCLEMSRVAAPFFLGAEFINVLTIIIAAFATAQQYHLAHGQLTDPRLACVAAVFFVLIILCGIIFVSVALVATAGYDVLNAANRLVARVAARRPIADVADAMHLRAHVLACPLRFEPGGFAIEIHHGISALYLLISALTTVFAYKVGSFGIS